MGSSKKDARRAAAMAEQERRWRATEASAPISRSDLQALVNHVADTVMRVGHDGTLRATLEWIGSRGLAPGRILEFLEGHRITDDYSLMLGGDPFTLFGPADGRTAWMPLERGDLEALTEALDARCRSLGCDDSLRGAKEYLVAHGLPVGPTLGALLARGGGCDCEVVLNVDPDAIYLPTRGPRRG